MKRLCMGVALAAMLLLTACQPGEGRIVPPAEAAAGEAEAARYAIGDVILADGSAIPAAELAAVDEAESARYAIGDVILADGSAIPAAELAAVDGGNAPVAVVAGFRDDGAAFGVGVHRSDDPLPWALEGSAGHAIKFAEIVSAQAPDGSFTGDRDGSDNWSAICARDSSAAGNPENYPAFRFVNTYARVHRLGGGWASGWYMPSIAELDALYQNRAAVDRALKAIHGLDGGVAMDGLGTNWYWASSQAGSEDGYAWFVHFFNGYAGECPKDFTNVHAIAIRAL